MIFYTLTKPKVIILCLVGLGNSGILPQTNIQISIHKSNPPEKHTNHNYYFFFQVSRFFLHNNILADYTLYYLLLLIPSQWTVTQLLLRLRKFSEYSLVMGIESNHLLHCSRIFDAFIWNYQTSVRLSLLIDHQKHMMLSLSYFIYHLLVDHPHYLQQ